MFCRFAWTCYAKRVRLHRCFDEYLIRPPESLAPLVSNAWHSKLILTLGGIVMNQGRLGRVFRPVFLGVLLLGLATVGFAQGRGHGGGVVGGRSAGGGSGMGGRASRDGGDLGVWGSSGGAGGGAGRARGKA